MRRMMPPPWAEALLRLVLPARDRETVSGDLLEEYRDGVLPDRGHDAADRWYVRQVAGFAWRAHWPWAVLLAAASVGRLMLDALEPVSDFHARSLVSTAIGIGVFVAAGGVAAVRARDVRAGAVAGVAIGTAAALANAVGALAFVAVRHDPLTLAAIAGSGGLAEALTLPVLVLAPGTALAFTGAVIGRLLSLPFVRRP